MGLRAEWHGMGTDTGATDEQRTTKVLLLKETEQSYSVLDIISDATISASWQGRFRYIPVERYACSPFLGQPLKWASFI